MKKIQWLTEVRNMPGFRVRMWVWTVAAVICLLLSWLVMHQAQTRPEQEFLLEECQEQGQDVYQLPAGGTLEQRFTAQGKSTGGFSRFYLQIFREADAEGTLLAQVYRVSTGERMLTCTLDIAALPDKEGFSQLVQQEEPDGIDSWATLVDDTWYYELDSGEDYRIVLENGSSTDAVYVLGNREVQSGQLLLSGSRQPGFVNLRFIRQDQYKPSKLLLLMVLLTDATVLTGLALVLFGKVKPQVLYLILAVGFGLVMLFDLTPLYGFDMRFQFDSTYVLSNRLLGLGDAEYKEDAEVSGGYSAYYYRRVCDDYSQYQFYREDEITANYTDTWVGLRNPFVSREKQELILVESNQGFISSPLYMYFPQALAFAAARLLGLGMYPMLQLARAFSYALFVAVMYCSIRAIPYGKRILLILGLTPAVLIQVISLSRDAVIITLSFFVIAQVLKLYHGEQKPDRKSWIPVLLASILLAPAKMVYLPVSCLFLMVLVKHYILPAGERAKKLIARLILAMIAAVAVLAVMNSGLVISLLYAPTVSVYGTPAYSLGDILEAPLHMLYVTGNTLREQLGKLLLHSLQLFDIGLGAGDGVSLMIVGLLILECLQTDTDHRPHAAQRIFQLTVSLGVFLLLILAAVRWTPVTETVFIGLQGRYLIPVLPLLCLSVYNNRLLRVAESAQLVTMAGCCIFPAICLMNMYLWSISLHMGIG